MGPPCSSCAISGRDLWSCPLCSLKLQSSCCLLVFTFRPATRPPDIDKLLQQVEPEWGTEGQGRGREHPTQDLHRRQGSKILLCALPRTQRHGCLISGRSPGRAVPAAVPSDRQRPERILGLVDRLVQFGLLDSFRDIGKWLVYYLCRDGNDRCSTVLITPQRNRDIETVGIKRRGATWFGA